MPPWHAAPRGLGDATPCWVGAKAGLAGAIAGLATVGLTGAGAGWADAGIGPNRIVNKTVPAKNRAVKNRCMRYPVERICEKAKPS
jgi:hypothetical protein